MIDIFKIKNSNEIIMTRTVRTYGAEKLLMMKSLYHEQAIPRCW